MRNGHLHSADVLRKQHRENKRVPSQDQHAWAHTRTVLSMAILVIALSSASSASADPDRGPNDKPDSYLDPTTTSSSRREIVAMTKSVAQANKLISDFQSINPKFRRIVFQVLSARQREQEGDLTAALHEAKIAISLIDDMLNDTHGYLDRTIASNWLDPYEIVVRILLQSGRTEDAIDQVDASKARVFVSQIQSPPRSKIQITGRTRIRHLKLKVARAKLERRIDADKDNFHIKEKLRRDLAETNDSIEDIEFSFRRRLLRQPPISRVARNSLTDRLSPVIMYYLAKNELTIFLLRANSPPLAKSFNMPRNTLDTAVNNLRNELANPAMRRPASEHTVAGKLYRILLFPFERELSSDDRVVIIPHGPLHKLPFSALLVDAKSGTRLWQRFDITLAPSLSALHSLHARAKKKSVGRHYQRFVGLATQENLAHATGEVQRVAEIFRVGAQVTLLGPDATFDAYQKFAPQAQYLLLSTHGHHRDGSRSSSYLELAPSKTTQRRLTARDIATITLQAELVALSACDTAAGEAMFSDERLDLARAFLIAGADSVLAALWKVPDTPDTGRFIKDFFRAVHILDLTREKALTYAQQQAISRGVDPQLWAAWVLIGSRGVEH